MELRNAVVVITGASSGIGKATAIAFAQRDARVVLVARRLDRLEDLAERIERAGGRALALKCDVADVRQLDKLPGIVEQLVGATDVLVNNAGVPGGGDFPALTHDQIDEIVRVNLLGVLHAGGGYYGAFPIEMALFADGGVAWTDRENASFFGGDRQPVTSAGVAFRVNLFGFAIGELDVVRPFDRPGKGWFLDLSLTPGY